MTTPNRDRELDLAIAKYKQAGLKDNVIASKLAISEKEVRDRFAELKSRGERLMKNGMAHMMNFFSVHCQQYQMMGQGLEHIGHWLDSRVEKEKIADTLAILHDDLQKIPREDLLKLAEGLLERFIILPVFQPPVMTPPHNPLQQAVGSGNRN